MPQPNSLTDSIWVATASHESYPTLQQDLSVDVAIIGGGITGITAAYQLQKAGKKVAILEAASLGSGVTGYTTAHITVVMDARFQTLIKRFGVDKMKTVVDSARQAIEHIAQTIEREHIDCDFQRVPGYLFSEDDSRLDELQREKAAADQLGIDNELMGPAPLPFPSTATLKFPNQAQFHPLKYIQGLARVVSQHGGQIFENTRVLEIKKSAPHKIMTEHGTVTAEHVIMATHTPITSMLSIQGKVSSFRSYVLAVTLKTGALPAGLYWDMVHPYHYIRSYQAAGGEPIAIIGGEDHRQGAVTNTAERYAKLRQYTSSHFSVAGVKHQWSAQLFNPFDDLPFIGRAPLSRSVYIATGFAGTGMTSGTVAGLLLSDMIMGKANAWA